MKTNLIIIIGSVMGVLLALIFVIGFIVGQHTPLKPKITSWAPWDIVTQGQLTQFELTSPYVHITLQLMNSSKEIIDTDYFLPINRIRTEGINSGLTAVLGNYYIIYSKNGVDYYFANWGKSVILK